MKKIILLLAAIAFQIEISAQPMLSTFQRTLKASGDEFAGTVIEADNGDFITVGFTSTGSGTLANKEDALIVRTDKYGNTIWAKAYGDTARQHFLHIVKDAGDTYYVTGFSEGRGVKGTDGTFGKIDGSGNLLWLKAYGGNGDEELRRIVKATDGGFFLFGHSTSPLGAGIDDNYIVKVNNTGAIQWTRLFGGSNQDRIRSAITDSIGNIVITGFTNSFGAGGKDVFVTKMTQAGVFKWSYLYGKNTVDKAQDVVIATGGNIVIAGDTKMPLNINPANSNAFLMKLDSLGNKKWMRVYEDSTETDIWALIKTPDNGYVFATDETPLGVTAFSTTNVSFAKVSDATGNVIFSRRIAGNKKDKRPDVIIPSDGGFLVVSSSASFASDTMRNIYLVRTNSVGVSGCNTFYRGFTKVDTGFTKAPVNWITATDGSTAAVTWTPQTRVMPHDTLCQNLLVTGIQSTEKSSVSFRVFPNPSTGEFTIESSDENYTLVVRDLLGKVIYTSKNELRVNLKNNAPGIYFLTVSNAQSSSTTKIILEE